MVRVGGGQLLTSWEAETSCVPAQGSNRGGVGSAPSVRLSLQRNPSVYTCTLRIFFHTEPAKDAQRTTNPAHQTLNPTPQTPNSNP